MKISSVRVQFRERSFWLRLVRVGLLKRENVIRTRRRLRRLQAEYAAGEMSWDEVTRAVHGWLGHAGFGDTYRLRERVFEAALFQKAA
jgi:hypothetical protein